MTIDLKRLMGIIILDPVSKTGPQSDIYQSGLSSTLIRILPNCFKIGAFSFFFTKNRRGRNYLLVLNFFFIIMLDLFKEKKITLLIQYHINFIDASIYLNVKF